MHPLRIFFGILCFSAVEVVRGSHEESDPETNEVHAERRGGHDEHDHKPPPTSYQQFNLISKDPVPVKITVWKPKKPEWKPQWKPAEWMPSQNDWPQPPAPWKDEEPAKMWHPVPSPPEPWSPPAWPSPPAWDPPSPPKKWKSSPPKKWQPSGWD